MKKSIVFLFVLLLPLCGCMNKPSAEQPMEYVYHTEEVVYSEEHALRIYMECTETLYGRYYFEPNIDKQIRSQCIESTDHILTRQVALNSIPEIFVFTKERYPEVFIEENQLYLPLQEWNSVEYAANVLLAAYGPYCHYGVAYGYAALICNGAISGSSFAMPSKPDACDLNLLCFDRNFVSEEDIAAVKGIASGFVQWYIADGGEAELQNLLSASGTAEGALLVSEALEQYYLDNGLNYVPSSLRYGYGGQSYDYIVADDLAAFYVYQNWKDMNAQANPLVYEGFLHRNYPDVKAFFQTNLEQMRQYQKLFTLDSYNNDLRVLFDNSNLSKYSFYRSDTHTIHLKNVDSLMHEYIHALTQTRTAMEAWETEGFARYFSYRYDYYGIAFLNQDYNHLPQTSETKYVHEYLNEIQRPIDMAIDYERLENIAVWYFRFRDPNENYLSGSSFVQYLVNQYGEKAVIEAIYGDQTPLPKPYEELVKDWIAYIESCGEGYSQYKKAIS